MVKTIAQRGVSGKRFPNVLFVDEFQIKVGWLMPIKGFIVLRDASKKLCRNVLPVTLFWIKDTTRKTVNLTAVNVMIN
tara:strand:- start:125 stop:358 length:234 start_codon:yes stop_codon:yes gene_type:complete